MLRARFSLSAIVALLCLTDLSACVVATRGQPHVTRTHGHVHRAPARHVHHRPVRHRHVGAPGAVVVVDAHVAPAPVYVVPASEPVHAAPAPAQSPCAAYSGTGCYWMENSSGNYCWVPADWANTFEECFAMDSCDGGRGESGGGCYKWAESSHANRVAW
jgi:hypothetical protein